MKANATFKTKQAPRYLADLCDHFSQKVTATHDHQIGHVEFQFGACELVAKSEQLEMTASAQDAALLEQVIDVITRHLERFAFRENPRLHWHRPTVASPAN